MGAEKGSNGAKGIQQMNTESHGVGWSYLQSQVVEALIKSMLVRM